MYYTEKNQEKQINQVNHYGKQQRNPIGVQEIVAKISVEILK